MSNNSLLRAKLLCVNAGVIRCSVPVKRQEGNRERLLNWNLTVKPETEPDDMDNTTSRFLRKMLFERIVKLNRHGCLGDPRS